MNLKQLLIAMGEHGVGQAKGSTYHPIRDRLAPITEKSCDEYQGGYSLRDLLVAGLYPLNPDDPKTPIIDLNPPYQPGGGSEKT